MDEHKSLDRKFTATKVIQEVKLNAEKIHTSKYVRKGADTNKAFMEARASWKMKAIRLQQGNLLRTNA